VVGPLCGPPLRWWVLCGALPSVWVPCVGPLCGSPVWVPCVGPLCVGPLCGSPVWVPRRAALHEASTRVMSPARSHAPALYHPNPTTWGALYGAADLPKLRLTPWALKPFFVGVLSAAAAIRNLPHK